MRSPVALRTDDDGAGPVPTATSGEESRALSYNAALDGIRGLAVAAVLAFHGGFAWARGGYLGVSTFFTLSGFLITTLLLSEHRSTGGIDLRGFWARRMRRLLPAATATLGVVMASALLTNEGWERALPWDVTAALAQVANWRFLFEDRAYAALFDLPSPVLHYWSLAIEEQFYWLFPALTLGVLKLAKGSRQAVGGVLGGMLAVALLGAVLVDDPEVVYYATPIRMGEIVVGALLAVGMMTDAGRRLSRSAVSARWVGGLGAAALVASVWAWWKLEWPSTTLVFPVTGWRLELSFLADGGLLLYAVGSACIVAAACVDGPIKQLLSLGPLRRLGVISYGVYLIHWPLFVMLNEERVDSLLSPVGWEPRGVSLFALQVALTLALASASFRFLEQPIRRGQRPVRLRAPVLVAGSAVAVLAAAVVVPKVAEPPEDMFVATQEDLHQLEGLDVSELADDGGVGVTLGDSTLLMTTLGLSDWGFDTRRMVLHFGGGGIGCPLGRGGESDYRGSVGEIPEHCNEWETQLPVELARARERYGDRVTFVLLQAGPWDVTQRRLDGDDRWLHIGDEAYDEFLRSEMETATDLALDEGLVAVWLTAPRVRPSGHPSLATEPGADPERMDALNEMVNEVAAQSERAVVVDLAEWVESQPEDEDERLRPDGIHFDEATSREVADWLGPEILAAAVAAPDRP